MDNILMIDDETEVQKTVSIILSEEEISVTCISEGQKTMALLKKGIYDLVLLDLHLGNMDGFDLLREIRSAYPALPVLILSARKESHKIVLGFGLGADDYITKPFNNEELVARIKGNIRRSRIKQHPSSGQSEMLICSCFSMDCLQYTLFKDGKKIELSSRLMKMMMFFMKNPDRVFSKEQIYDNVWDDGYYDEQTVIVYIQKLRQTIEDNPENPSHLQTLRGLGYKFNGKQFP
jgi:DNA-binding response OmpR family regulator